jgi:uncharacterized membrane protein
MEKERVALKQFNKFILGPLVSGFLIFFPIYLAILLLLKAMKSIAVLVRPFTRLLPDWLPAENILALSLILTLCFLIGVVVRTRAGRAIGDVIERSAFGKIPGYTLFRSLTLRLAGREAENIWKPALAEIEDALVPAFIIEELQDGRFTVFVPSVPTPLAGAVYILARKRVHPLNVSFAHALGTISRWGSGASDLVAAMETDTTKP